VEKQLQLASAIVGNASGVAALPVVDRPGLGDMGLYARTMILTYFVWLSEALDTLPREDRWAALVGAVAHEYGHMREPSQLTQKDKELWADGYAKKILKKLGLPHESFKKLLAQFDQSADHPLIHDRIALLGLTPPKCAKTEVFDAPGGGALDIPQGGPSPIPGKAADQVIVVTKPVVQAAEGVPWWMWVLGLVGVGVAVSAAASPRSP